MKFISFTSITAILATTAVAFPLAARDASDADIARLAPDLGLKKGQNPSGAGDCLSNTVNDAGQTIRIPCSCPPDPTDFIAALQANVHAGHAVHNPTVKVDFPTDDSKESKLARITASSITIQNLEGPGVGCPIASTTLKKQAAAIEAGANDTTASSATTDTASSSAPFTSTTATSTDASSSASDTTYTVSSASISNSSPSISETASSSEPTSSSPDASDDDIARLVPEFGVAPGQNPTGTGDCDGAGNPSGQPIRIPCQCPPNRADFIQSLIENVRAGHVLKNPSISVTFPTDDSKTSKQARLNTAAVTLQNFAGEGKGCPLAATSWKKLGQAIADGTDGSSGQATSTTASPSASTTVTSTDTPSTRSSSSTGTFSTGASSSNTTPVASSTKSTAGSSTTDTPVDGIPSDDDIARLAPDLGGTAGVNPSGTGDCDGVVKNSSGKPIKVPCSCPPSRDAFIAALQANVHAGKATKNPSVALTFPVGDSVEEKLARINAAAITVQNLDGAGKGCPIAATTLGVQAQELRTGKAPTSAPTSSTATTAPTSSTTSSPTATSSPSSLSTTDATSTTAAPSSDSTGLPSDALVASLAPELGWQAGVNPTGTGNCDGAVNGADGKPIQIPCSCPPTQDVYIAALQENARAGKAVNNPTVSISFPTDDSKDSQRARITAALITLQNLNGVGKGCPASATTLLKQQKALDAN
ncbi:hypothetical protein BKA62DRAFT_472175 [Auriculariales sp. MPI-PUGE-AT-0066]|nr:hypothetical protein BKA62DRAFT_472175 [Auriculariales sp. MPI-PUGE-AT-0066]